MTNNYTGKGRFELRVDRPTAVLSGEMVSVANVLQVNELTVTGPYSGDFQIIDNGRLIVGSSPDVGSRIIISPKSMAGYSAAGTKTFSLWTSTSPDGNNTPGDLHLGNLAANFLLYDHSEGTLGLYTPAGAGILLSNDGSARFGQGDGAHMLWDSSTNSLKFISQVTSEGAVIAAEIDTMGNASFVGNITATGGRITGDMQVDARLRAGDVDGPAVYIGKLTNEDGSAYAGQILVTDTENVPWFSVTTGNDGTGHLQIGRPGNYPNRLTMDVTATGSTLVYDGDIYTGNGQIAGWTINQTQIVSDGGDLTLDKDTGIEVFMSPGAIDDVKRLFTYVDENRVSYGGIWSGHDTTGLSINRVNMHFGTYANATTTNDARSSVRILSNSHAGRQSILTLQSSGDNGAAPEATIELRSLGGDDGNYGLIGFTGMCKLEEHTTEPTATAGLGVADGLFGFPDGSGWHPLTYITANKYTVARLDGAWVPLAQAWGTVWRWGNGSTNYAEIDGNGSVTLTGTARISPRYNSETQNSSASWNITKPITFANSTSTGAMTASLPDATTVTGTPYTVVKIDASANAVNVTPYGAQTINGSASAYAITARWQTATFFSNGSNWVIIWT